VGKDARDPRGRSGRVVRAASGAREDQSRPGRAARSPRRDPRHRMSPSETISPTAHYTGYVWARNGLSHPRLETLEGRVMFESLRDEGPNSISGLAADLDPESGLAIITEGLLGYLDTGSVDGIWRRFARTLSGFASGRYISDLHLGSVQNAQIRAFRAALSVFVRGQVHLHFDNAQQAEGALRDAGFARAKLYRASDVPGTEPVS